MRKRFLLLIGVALVLNLIWEFSHYRLYVDLSGISPVPHLLLASFTDMIILTVIFSAISLKNKNLEWIQKPSRLDYVLIVVFGILVATFIELRALRIERWAYQELMPTIFGIGLSPLLQLFVTGIVSLWIARFLLRKS